MSSIRKVGKYEVGRTLGEGTFAKVKFAQNMETGESMAMKVIDKEKILKHKMVEQIKREISIMKLVRHPNVVHLHEVLASRSKIYIVLEFVTGGELFDKIVHQGKLSEDESRKYFQQLVDAVDYCHSKGVFHRDLKPENLLLDAKGNLKISDFGLSALPQQIRDDGLLHTTCGTPNYVAPEVLNDRGYDGRSADVWSCGVILYVLMAGFLPFDEPDLTSLYKKIHKAEFTCPKWFSAGAQHVVKRVLDANPKTRATFNDLRRMEWFQKDYNPVDLDIDHDTSLDDIDAVFNNSSEHVVMEEKGRRDMGPMVMNAFEIISLSQGLNLSALFDQRQDMIKRQTRFTSRQPANEIITQLQAVGKALGFTVQSRGYKMKMEKRMPKGPLAMAIEVFEMAPSVYMVEVRRATGDTFEYHKVYKAMLARLKPVVWKTEVDMSEPMTESQTPTKGASPNSSGRKTGERVTKAVYPRMGIIVTSGSRK